ncbi:MAG TPA: RodZ domain-containing protein [Gaiellaceae bacterium]|nr:RodZ domain-containing protein [Gaiellaceae bacterium]
MFEIGSSLRQARQHRGLELADVERETHIRAKYLGALEEERFEVLPGQAYVRGFLRTYAEFLGLNGGLYVDEYNEKFAAPEEELPPIQHRPQRVRELPRVARPVAGAVVALAAATVVVWQLGFSPPQRTAITQTQLVAPVKKQTAPARRTSSQPRRVQATPKAPGTLVVRASRGDCWVEVRLGSETGPVVYERVLGEGGMLRFGLRKKLWLRLGAPWNADVTVRGKPVGGLPHAPVSMTAA